MLNVTISKKITKGEELVIIPRKEYEELSRWHRTLRQFKEFTPTSTQRKDMRQAREDYKKGRHLTLHGLKKKLAGQDTR